MKKSFFSKLRLILIDFISSAVASWSFILIYTLMIISWVVLHELGILSVDSKDYTKYNLFLGFLAGIQASIVLMANNRQSEKDRLTLQEGVDIDKKAATDIKKMYKKVSEMTLKINKLEEIIEEMETEEYSSLNEEDLKNEKNDN